MSTYRNVNDDRTLQVWADGSLRITPDNPASQIRAFTLRPEDTYRVIHDLTRDTVIPDEWATPEQVANNIAGYTDDYLRMRVAQYAGALAVRAERAAEKAKAEADDAAKLDEEAEALYRARWGEERENAWEMLVPKADWRNVARAARKLHAPNETPEATR